MTVLPARSTSKELATEKTVAVAEGLLAAAEEPGQLKKALLDAKGFLSASASWAWDALAKVMKSEAVQTTLATITEASVQGAIKGIT